MDIETEQKNNYVIIKLKGNLIEGPKSDEFNKIIHQLIDDNKTYLIIDLGNVSYVNSTGLSILYNAHSAIKNVGGKMKLVSLNKKMQNLISITKLNTIFDVYDSEEIAAKSFQ